MYGGRRHHRVGAGSTRTLSLVVDADRVAVLEDADLRRVGADDVVALVHADGTAVLDDADLAHHADDVGARVGAAAATARTAAAHPAATTAAHAAAAAVAAA